MRHYIQYHKSWEEGHPLANARPYVFTTSTDSKLAIVDNVLDGSERVWLIYRTAPDSKDYYVGYTFQVTDVDISDEKVEMFGDEGTVTVFNPPIPLSRTRQSWFPEFLKKHGNFAFGLMPLQDDFTPEFDTFLASEHVAKF